MPWISIRYDRVWNYSCLYQYTWKNDITFQFFVHAMLFKLLRPRQNGCHFANGIFKCIPWKEMCVFLVWIHRGMILHSSSLYMPCYLSYWCRDKIAAILQMAFWNVFLERKCVYFWYKLNFTDFVPKDRIHNKHTMFQIMTWSRRTDA